MLFAYLELAGNKALIDVMLWTVMHSLCNKLEGNEEIPLNFEQTSLA